MKVSTGPGVEEEFEYTFTLLDPCASVTFREPSLED